MKIEGILVSIFIILWILKSLSVPGSNIGLTAFLISASFIYFFLGFYLFNDAKGQQQNFLFSIFAGICISIVPTALLFKIMHWDHGNLYITIGISITLLLFALSYFIKSKASLELHGYYTNMLIRTGVLTLLQLIFIIL